MIENLDRLDDCRISKQLQNYKPKGQESGASEGQFYSILLGPKQIIYGLIIAEDDDDEGGSISVDACRHNFLNKQNMHERFDQTSHRVL